MGEKIYLDYNATTPIDKCVAEAIHDTLRNAWGNPSSCNDHGSTARSLIEKARKEVADMINAKCSDIVFTSGGTESNNWVINTAVSFFKKSIIKTLQGCYEGKLVFTGKKPHIITSAVEHDSIKLPLEYLEKQDLAEVSWINIDKDELVITKDSVLNAIRPNTCLVTIMMANNETGTIMPIADIFEAIRSRTDLKNRILLHTDAAQAIGKVLVDVQDLNTDYLTIVGHKFYGPRIGALYVNGLANKNAPLYPVFFGGGQERNYRPGTENTPMIVGLGKACLLAHTNLKKYSNNMLNTRDYLEENLQSILGDKVQINCSNVKRLPNTSNLSFIGDTFQGYKMLENIRTFNCSTGSACHSDSCQPSQVLLNFHITKDVAINALRISTGRNTTKEDIDIVVNELTSLISKVQ